MQICHLVTRELSLKTLEDFASLLSFYAESGVDFCVNDTPTNWVTLSQEPEKPRFIAPLKVVATQSAPMLPPAPQAAVAGAVSSALNCTTLQELQRALGEFNGSPLKKTAKNLIFATGNATAQIMFIGDTPKGEDDALGAGFSGAYGELMDNMLKAIGLTRESTYLTQIIPYRPPGNRPPTPLELANFLPFMQKHIELIAPKVIVLLGGLATMSLLGSSENLVKLRGKPQKLQGVTCIPTFHPEYLLKHPLQKQLAYADLLAVKLLL